MGKKAIKKGGGGVVQPTKAGAKKAKTPPTKAQTNNRQSLKTKKDKDKITKGDIKKANIRGARKSLKKAAKKSAKTAKKAAKAAKKAKNGEEVSMLDAVTEFVQEGEQKFVFYGKTPEKGKPPVPKA